MCVLIGNTVKTETGEYPCKTREEAEALYLQILEREKSKQSRPAKQSAPQVPQKAEVD